jgi:hypothetical protein
MDSNHHKPGSKDLWAANYPTPDGATSKTDGAIPHDTEPAVDAALVAAVGNDR